MGAAPILVALARGPWPSLLAASLAGWVALIASGHWLIVSDYCSASAGHWLVSGWRGMEAALLLNPPAGLVWPWLMMLLAMMPPLLAQPVAHLWDRSLACRRLRAIALFAMGYAAVWMLVGIVLMMAAIALKTLVGAAVLPAAAVAVAIALLWQATPIKQACLNRCHRLPRLSAFGLAADRDCLRYGLVAAFWCVGTCWALMLVPLVADQAHAAVMAVSAAVLLAERAAPARPLRWRLLPIDAPALARKEGTRWW